MRANEAAQGARYGDEPRFREPWEARAFALVLALHEANLFAWSEWAAALSREIHAPPESGTVEGGAPITASGSRRSKAWSSKRASEPGSVGRARGSVGARRTGDAARSADRARQRSTGLDGAPGAAP